MTRLRETAISVVVIAVCLALAVSFPAIAQQAPVAEDWRATRAETSGVMLDLDPANNVLVVGETIASVVTRKYAPDGTLRWERVAPPPPDRARASWIATDPAGNAIVAAYRVTGTFDPAGWLVIKYDPQGNLLWQDVIPVAQGGPSASRPTMPATPM